MLKILDEKVMRTGENIEKEYSDCMFILTYYSDLENPKGYLYCISTSKESYREICKQADELERQNIPCILMGNYKDGIGSGLVYEMI